MRHFLASGLDELRAYRPYRPIGFRAVGLARFSIRRSDLWCHRVFISLRNRWQEPPVTRYTAWYLVLCASTAQPIRASLLASATTALL